MKFLYKFTKTLIIIVFTLPFYIKEMLASLNIYHRLYMMQL